MNIFDITSASHVRYQSLCDIIILSYGGPEETWLNMCDISSIPRHTPDDGYGTLGCVSIILRRLLMCVT